MSHSQLIEKLGDTGAVALELEENPSTVSMWKQRGIPWRWRPTIAKMAEQRGVQVPDDFLVPGAA